MKDRDLFDIVFDKIKKIGKFVGIFLLMMLWQSMLFFILEIFGIDINNLNDTLKVVFMFISDLLFLVLLFFIYRKDLTKEFKNFFNKKLFSNIRLSFNYWIVGLIIMVISNGIIAVITNGSLAGNEESVRELIDKFPIYMAFQVMLYAPITEEIIFRKTIKKSINNKWFYILISGFVFGGLHVIGNVETSLDWLYLIPYCSLGFIFAMLYNRTNNIFSTITAHSFHNTLAFILYLLG